MAKKRSHDHLFEEDESQSQSSEFDALLNGAPMPMKRFSPGDRFKGEILSVTSQEAFISTGTPTDAVMAYQVGPDDLAPQVGEVIDVVVVRARDGEIFVRKVGARGVSVEVDSIEDAYKMQLPVDGIVTEAVKGGFRVKVMGQKAFCPVSQMDFRVTVESDYVGKKFQFVITKYERNRDLVVSRRRLLEGDRKQAEGQFFESAQVDDIFSGTIFRLEKYGAFIRLESGVEGLIPVSEIGFQRINHPQDVLNLDQNVQVKLIRKSQEEGRLKITFSIKQGGSVEDPWTAMLTQFPIGTQIEGTVEGRESFGLFINIANGITGLLPRSAWRDSSDGSQYENKKRGDKVKVQIAQIDLEARRLSFCLPGEEIDESWKQHSSAQKSGKNGMGTFADLLKGAKKN